MIQDRQVLALNKARLLEALPKSAQKLFVLRYGSEHSDHRHRGLLRARRERPRRRCAADERDEIAPVHSITSSASNCIALGIAIPSAVAVPRLITSSNLVGCSTGRSPATSPLRIRPASTPARRYASVWLGP